MVIQKRTKTGKKQISTFQQAKEYAELSGKYAEPIQFEWNIFPGFISIEKSDGSTKNQEQSEGRILFMSRLKDINWTKNGNSIECISNSI